MEAEIYTIIEKRNRTLATHNPESYSPEDIKAHTALNTHYYVLISTEEYPKGAYIDLSTMMLEQVVGQMDTWELFIQYMTPAMVDSYMVSGAGLAVDGRGTFHQAITIQPMSTIGLDISYCDRNDPSEMNKSYKKWDLPDLAISKKVNDIDDVSDINLNNCIVSINGVVCYSTVWKDILFVHEGAKNLWSINKDTSPNITMIDTTPLGDLVALPLSQCKIEYEGHDALHTYDKDIKIILPEGYTFDEYTPILSIAGKAHFPDTLTLPNERTITISPYKMNLQQCLLQLFDSQADYVYNSELIHPDATVASWLYSLGRSRLSDIYDVVYLIKANDIQVQREYCIPDMYWLTRACTNRPGISVRKSDGAWMDYALFDYTKYDLHFGVRYPQQLMRVTVEEELDRQLGVKEIRCHHLDDHFRWIRDSTYEMVYLTR